MKIKQFLIAPDNSEHQGRLLGLDENNTIWMINEKAEWKYYCGDKPIVPRYKKETEG